ncbi:hypothetical protein Hanom_Chr11g00993291 [Helianthus anomalus]
MGLSVWIVNRQIPVMRNRKMERERWLSTATNTTTILCFRHLGLASTPPFPTSSNLCRRRSA